MGTTLRRSWPNYIKLAAVRKVQKGVSRAVISSKFGIAEATLRRWCNDQDLISRTCNNFPGTRKMKTIIQRRIKTTESRNCWPAAVKNRIVRRLQNGEKSGDLAAEYGIPLSTIRWWGANLSRVSFTSPAVSSALSSASQTMLNNEERESDEPSNDPAKSERFQEQQSTSEDLKMKLTVHFKLKSRTGRLWPMTLQRKAVRRMKRGEKVSAISDDYGIPVPTLMSWRKKHNLNGRLRRVGKKSSSGTSSTVPAVTSGQVNQENVLLKESSESKDNSPSEELLKKAWKRFINKPPTVREKRSYKKRLVQCQIQNRTRRIWPQSLQRKAVNRIQKGENVKDLSDEYKVPIPTLKNWYRKYELKRPLCRTTNESSQGAFSTTPASSSVQKTDEKLITEEENKLQGPVRRKIGPARNQKWPTSLKQKVASRAYDGEEVSNLSAEFKIPINTIKAWRRDFRLNIQRNVAIQESSPVTFTKLSASQELRQNGERVEECAESKEDQNGNDEGTTEQSEASRKTPEETENQNKVDISLLRKHWDQFPQIVEDLRILMKVKNDALKSNMKATKELQKCRSEVENKDRIIKELQNSQREMSQKAEEELKNERAKVLRFQSVKDALQSTLRRDRARHADQEAELKAKNDELINEVETLKSKIKTLTDDNQVNGPSLTADQGTEKLRADLAQEQQENGKLKSKVSNLQKSMESIVLQYSQRRIALRGENEKLSNELKHYTLKNEQLSNENKSYCQRLAENQEKLKKLEADFGDERKLRVLLESTVSDLQKSIQTTELQNSKREIGLKKEKEELTNSLNEYKRKNEELIKENRSKFESLSATEDRLEKVELTLKLEKEHSKKRESFSVTLREKCSLLERQNSELETKLKQNEEILTNKIQEYDKIIENMSDEITLERSLRERSVSSVKEQLSKAEADLKLKENRCQELELRLSEMRTTELQHIQRETAAKNANEKLLKEIEEYKIKIRKLSADLNDLQEASQSRGSRNFLPIEKNSLDIPWSASEETNERETEKNIPFSDTSDEDDDLDPNLALKQIAAGCSIILKRVTDAQINQFTPIIRRPSSNWPVISDSSSSENEDADAEVETNKQDYDNLFAASPCPTCSGSSDDDDDVAKQSTTTYHSVQSPSLGLKLVKTCPKKMSPGANENKVIIKINSDYSSIYGLENINPNKVLPVRKSNYKPSNEIYDERKKTLERVKSSLQMEGSVVAKKGLSSPHKKKKFRKRRQNADEFPSLTKKKKLKKSSDENCATNTENRMGEMRKETENTIDPTPLKCNAPNYLQNYEIQIRSPTNVENLEFNDQIIVLDVNKNITPALRKGESHDTATVPNSAHVSSSKKDTFKERDVFHASVEQTADDTSTRRPSFTTAVPEKSNNTCSRPTVIVTDPIIAHLSSFVRSTSAENRVCHSPVEQNESKATIDPNDPATSAISHLKSVPRLTESRLDKTNSFRSLLEQSIRVDTSSSNSNNSGRCAPPAVAANIMPSVANTNTGNSAMCQSSKELSIRIYESPADSTPSSRCTPPSFPTIANTQIVPSGVCQSSNEKKIRVYESLANSTPSSRCTPPSFPTITNTRIVPSAVCQSSKEQNIRIYESLIDSTLSSTCTPPSFATITNTRIVPSAVRQSSNEQNIRIYESLANSTPSNRCTPPSFANTQIVPSAVCQSSNEKNTRIYESLANITPSSRCTPSSFATITNTRIVPSAVCQSSKEQTIRIYESLADSAPSSRCSPPSFATVANTRILPSAVCQSSNEQNIRIYESLADSTPSSRCMLPSFTTIANTQIVPSLLNSNSEKNEMRRSSVEQNESACNPSNNLIQFSECPPPAYHTPHLKNLLLNSQDTAMCQYTKSTSARIEITEQISLGAHQLEGISTVPVTEERNLESASTDASESNAVRKSTETLPKSTRSLIKVRSRTELFDLPESSTTAPLDLNKLLCVDTAIPHRPNLSSAWSSTSNYLAKANSAENDLSVLIKLLKRLYETNYLYFGKLAISERDLTQIKQQLISEFRETFVRRLTSIRSVCGNDYENESKDLLRQILSKVNAELKDEIKNCKNYSVVLNEFFSNLAVEDFFPDSWFHCTMLEIVQVNEIDKTVNNVVNSLISNAYVPPARRRGPAKSKNVSNQKTKQMASKNNQNMQARNNTNQNVQMMGNTVSNIQMMNNIINQNTQLRCYTNKNMQARTNTNQNMHVRSNMNQNMQMRNSIHQNMQVMNTNPNMMPVQSNILINRPVSPRRVHSDFMDNRRAHMGTSVNNVVNSNTRPLSASYMDPQLAQYLPNPPSYESHIQQSIPMLAPQQLQFPGRDIHHPYENDQRNQHYPSISTLPSTLPPNYY